MFGVVESGGGIPCLAEVWGDGGGSCLFRPVLCFAEVSVPHGGLIEARVNRGRSGLLCSVFRPGGVSTPRRMVGGGVVGDSVVVLGLGVALYADVDVIGGPFANARVIPVCAGGVFDVDAVAEFGVVTWVDGGVDVDVVVDTSVVRSVAVGFRIGEVEGSCSDFDVVVRIDGVTVVDAMPGVIEGVCVCMFGGCSVRAVTGTHVLVDVDDDLAVWFDVEVEAGVYAAMDLVTDVVDPDTDSGLGVAVMAGACTAEGIRSAASILTLVGVDVSLCVHVGVRVEVVKIVELVFGVHVDIGVDVWVVMDVALCGGVVTCMTASSDHGGDIIGVGMDAGVDADELAECDVVMVVGVDVFDASSVDVEVTVILDVDVAASAVFGVDVGVGKGVIGD